MTFARPRTILCVPILLFLAETASAGVFMGVPISPTPLPRRDVYSKNEVFVLDVDPDAQRNTVYAANDRERPLWSFQGVLKTDVRQILLADNGSVVALIGGGAATIDDLPRAEAVRLIDRNGATRSYGISEFIKNPPQSYGCGGNSLRWFDTVTDYGDRFVIQTSDGKEHTFGYTTAPRSGKWFKVLAAGVGFGILLFLVRLAFRRPVPVPPPVELTP